MGIESGGVSPADPQEPRVELEVLGQEFIADTHALLAARTDYLAEVMKKYDMDISDVDMAAINEVRIDSDIDTLPSTTRWYFNAREHLVGVEDEIFASSLLYGKSDEAVRPHYYVYNADSLVKYEPYFDAGDGEWRQRHILYRVNNDGVIYTQVNELDSKGEDIVEASGTSQDEFISIVNGENGYVLTVKEARDLVAVLHRCGAAVQEYYREAGESL